MKHVLKHYNRKRGRHHPLLAVDCENDPKTGSFICAGVYGDIRLDKVIRQGAIRKHLWGVTRIEHYFEDQQEFINFLKSLKPNSCMLVFFNLAYDKWFFDKIVNHLKVIAFGSRLIMLELKNNKIKAIDLMNHVDGSLENWIEYLNMKEKGIKKVSLKDLKTRVLMDAKATYELGTFIEDFYYDECHIPLQVTVGSSSLKLFLMHYFKDTWIRDGEFFGDYERNAYYGGRVEVFRRGKYTSFNYDVNSMYLSIMKNMLLPDPSESRYKSKPPEDWKSYLNNYLGIWQVELYCPAMHVPLLPYHLDGKLKFPVGTFSGYYTSIELLAAVQAGYKILKVIDFVYYKNSGYYFKEYAEFIWSKRQEYKEKKNRGMELMIKKLGNSLYGKFAQRNDKGYFGRLSDFPGTETPDKFEIIDYFGEAYLSIMGDKESVKHQFTCLSVFIASYARLKLWYALRANEQEAIYCDTDSIKTLSPLRGCEVGDALGQWGLESQGEEIEFIRPKMYGTKRKGVPKRARLIRKTEEFEDWIFDKPIREREAIRRGLIPNKWITVQKHLSCTDDKRQWTGKTSYPHNIV